jgi:hypothetical protein
MSAASSLNLWQSFPLLILPVGLYNLIAFGGGLFSAVDANACAERMGHPVHTLACQLEAPLFFLPMASTVTLAEGVQRVSWGMTPSDLLMVFSLVLLFVEVLKATTARTSSVVNHALSLGVFVVALVEFLLFAPFATSTFFLVVLMTLLDVMAGFIVTIASTRRDVFRG